MESLCINIAPKHLTHSSGTYNNRYLTAFPRSATKAFSARFSNPLPLRSSSIKFKSNHGTAGKTGFRALCYSGGPILSLRNYQWISTISSVVLMLSRGTAANKSFLVPLFLLQAPPFVVSWIKGEYGIWAAFLALLLRLFFFVPGELELPFRALLLVIVAPYQVMNLRGTQEGAIIALLIASYLAFQHFSWAGDLQRAFDRGSLFPTLATICLMVTSFLLLI